VHIALALDSCVRPGTVLAIIAQGVSMDLSNETVEDLLHTKCIVLDRFVNLHTQYKELRRLDENGKLVRRKSQVHHALERRSSRYSFCDISHLVSVGLAIRETWQVASKKISQALADVVVEPLHQVGVNNWSLYWPHIANAETVRNTGVNWPKCCVNFQLKQLHLNYSFDAANMLQRTKSISYVRLRSGTVNHSCSALGCCQFSH
ncbi:hypothetical protein Ciccas_010805, partial [Cichlidogyrus casuarinus]